MDIEGNTYLHLASKSPGTVDILKLILGHAKKSSTNLSELLEKLNENSFTPLHYAIYHQNYEACRTLVNEKANLVYRTVNLPAFHETIGGLPLTICEYQHSYNVGYHFPYGNNLSWIISPLNNLKITKHTLDRTVKVPKDLKDHLVQEIVSCQLVQLLQSLLQQVNFSNYSPQRKKLILYVPAAQFGSLPVIQFLIKNYFSPQELMDLNHGNILYEAIRNPNLEIVKVLCDTVVEKHHLERIDKILSRKQGCDFCALELCVKLSRLETFQYFLQPEFCLSLVMNNPKGTTLFHYILENVRVTETRKQFLDILATAIQDRENKKPKSTYINNTPLVDCQIQDSGETPLHLCASKYPDCIGTILQLNPSPIKEDSSGNTALHLSVKSDNFNCTKEIVNAYENSISEIANKTNKKKQTPLHFAVEIANLEIVELLLRNNSKLYAVDDESRTILHYAVLINDFSRSEKMVKYILEHETNIAEPNQSLSTYQDHKGYTPLHSATVCSNVKALIVLLQSNSDYNKRDLDGNSIFHLALMHYNKSVTILHKILETFQKENKSLSASNENELINLKNNHGKTALILAVETANIDALKEILKYYPLLYLTDNDGNTCLHKAVESAHNLRCLRELLEIINKLYPDEMKSYLSAINANGLSPLHHAIKNQNQRAAEKLCEHGANIAIQLKNGELTLCNGKGIKFEIVSQPPSLRFKMVASVFTDHNDYFVCYDIVDDKTTYHIASLLPDLKSTTISTDLSTITSVTKRILEMICSCHCIEPLIYAIDVRWIYFSEYESENSKLWEVLCGDISEEVTYYLFAKYPDQMNPCQEFKSLENATKSQNKHRVISFLKRKPNFGKQNLFLNEEMNSLIDSMVLTIKNSLEYSIDNNNTDILNILLQHGVRFNHLYENKDTLLHMIIRKKRPLSFLTRILERNRELQSNNSEQLIEGNSMINHQNNEGKTALHICIENGHDELLGKLLEYQPDLTLSDASLNNILHCVSKLGSESIAKIIFDHLKSPFPNDFPETFFTKNKDGCTALHLTAEFGNESIFNTLLEKGADLYATDTLKQTTLHYSLKNENKDTRLAILSFILNLQNNEIKTYFIKCQNINGFSALQIAVKFQYENEVDLLLQANPATMYLEEKETRSNSLHLAVSTKNVYILDKILSCLKEEANASNGPSSFEYTIVCKRNIDGKTPVHLSIESKNLYALEKLLPLSKPCLEISDNDQDTLLHYAVKVSGDSCEYLKAVLEAFKTCYPEDFQSHLYPCNLDGFPPLQYAIELNRYQAATVLIENSVQLPYLNGEGICLLSNPKNKIPLQIYYEKQQSPNNLKYWIGYQIKSNGYSNWIVASLPDLSKTTYFDISKPIQEVSKLDRELLLAILQCHSTDPFKSAVNSKLITQNLKFNDGSSLLKYVGQYSTREVIAYFIDWYKCVIFESTKEQSSLIEYTVANSDQLVLRFLLEKLPPIVDQSLSPLQPNATKEVNEQYKIALCLKNALKLSLNNHNIQALELLLEFNAKHDHTYDGLNTLLHLMVIQRKPCEYIKSLLTRNRKVEKLPADPGTIRFIDAQNAQKETGLHLALQTKQENTIKAILSFGPEIVTKDSKGNTPLHLAILLNNYDIIETVLNLSKHDPKIVNAVNKQKCTPLHLSVDNGDYRVTELLLTSKADIYCRDNEEKTILHHAIEIVDSERRSLMFNGLIKFEDKTFGSHKLCTTEDKRGNTPLNLAITKSDNGIVTSLLEYPSVLKVTNKQGETPLHLAVINKDEKTMESILNAIKKTEKLSSKNFPKRDSPINSQDSTGCTPLHLSIQQKNTDALTKLLAANPYLDIFNDDGDQPLHLAVLSEEKEIFNCVLDSILKLEVGCIGWLEQRLTCMKQRNGKTPLHLSIENNNTHALHSLLQTKPCLDVCDTNGDTVVHCAAKNSSDDSTCLEIVLEKLEERFSDDYSYHTYMINSRKLTPLHYAIKFSKLNCIKKLLEHQVNLAFLDPCGDKTLLDGIDSFSLSFVKHNGEYWIGYKFTKARKPYWILTKLPNLNLTEIVERDLPTTKISDFELLKLISQSESTEPLDAALRNKLLNVNTSLNHEHMSQVIARHGTKQSLRCLLSKTKSGLFHRSDGKLSMIECAVSNPNTDALEYLLHSLPTFQQQPGGIASKENVLSFLEKHPNVTVLELNKTTDEIFSNKANENALASTIKNSLEYSIDNDDTDILNIFLQHGVRFNYLYENNDTLLHLIIRKNRPVDFLTSILEKNRELRSNDSEYLIEGVSMINHRNNSGKTPLHICIENRNDILLEKLLDYQTDLTLHDASKNNILHCIAKLGSESIAQIILNHLKFTFPNGIPETFFAKNKDGNTPLHFAAASGNESICSTLLERAYLNADLRSYLNATNTDGLSPLHHAIMNGNHRAAEELCEYGANIAIQLQNGKITLCNGGELKFNIGVGQPPSTWRTIKDIVWGDAKDYFVCYAIVDKDTTYHIASLLPDLKSTAISTSHLKIISNATDRALEVICSCHCIEPLIYAIDKGWIDFSKEEANIQWKVLCGNISAEVKDYLYTKYPDQMKSSKMFKPLESTSKTENKDKMLSSEHKYELDRLIQNDPITINPDGGSSHTEIHREISKNSKLLTNFVSCLNEAATLNDNPLFESNFLNNESLYDKRPVAFQDISDRSCDAFGKILPSTKPSIEIDNSQVLSLHSAVLGSEGNCEYLKGILEELKRRYPNDFSTRLSSCNSKGFPPLQNAIESNNLQAVLILLEYSAQLPYFTQDNRILIRSPQSKLPLRIFYTTLKSAKRFPNVFWTGFCIQLSSDVSSNWIATSLPELSKTEYFDKSSPMEEALKLSEELLKVILQCHSTDPFESAVNSGLITKNLQFQDGSTLLKYIGQYSSLEMIHHFINRYNYVSFECTNGQSSLIEYAVSNLNVSVLRYLLDKLPSIVDQSLSPLQQNSTQEVVVQYKIALCLKNALRLSLNNDNVQALELLVDFNARYDHTYGKQQNTLLHLMVIQQKSCTFVECLLTKTRKSEKIILDRGASLFIDAQNANKETALHLALQTKQESVIKAILDSNPEIVSKDSNGNTPLHLSILLNNYEIIEAILKHCKQNLKLVNSVNRQNCTPLHLSVDNGDYKVTELLLRSNVDIYCQDHEGRTVLHHAVKIADSVKRYLMFDELIKFEEITFSTDRLCTIKDSNGNTPFSLAYAMSDHDIVTRLLEIPSVLKVTNESQQTPIHLAILNRDERSLESILNAIKKTENISDENIPKKDSIINSQDSTGCTPLHLSIQQNNTDALTKLLAVKPCLDIFNNDGDQPLHLAVLSEENDILTCVLDSILKLEAGYIGWLEQRLTSMKQRNGKTPLHLSIENNNTHALHSLLQTKPCLDVCDTNGDTVVHCAAKNSSDDSTCLEIVLKELEERFSDDYSYHTNFQNSRKLTPLHYAIKSSNLNCIKKLLEHQVNLAFLDPCGDKTLLDGIDGFSLSFVEQKGEYWIGYKFTKARKPNWILTKLPNLNYTEIVERDLPTTISSDFELLKLISQSESTEPLDAALRNKLLNVDTSLNHAHMSQVIARHGTKQSLRCLLSKTKSGLFHRSDGKLSMIECAVSNPNIDALEYLLHSLPAFQQQQQQQQQQPGGIALSEESTHICSCLKNSLLLSISNNSSEALISLLRFYPKMDCTYIDDNTLIHQMIIDNKSSKYIQGVLKIIGEIGTSNPLYKDKQIINHCNFEKKTALHCCIERKQLSTLEVLLQFNPEVFVVDKSDETPLHYAVNINELEFVQAIYRHTPCIELLSAKNNDADTALHLAVKNANDGIVKFLLECESPFDSQNSNGSTVLHLAVVIENPSQRKLIMIQLILHNANKGLNVTRIQDFELKSPLHLAVSK